MLKKSSVFLVGFLLLISMALGACSSSSGGKLTVAIDATYPPMEYMEGDTPVGFDVDLAREIGKKLGREVEFKVVDWDGILTGLTAKRYDIIMSSMNITEERLKEVNFVEYARMSQVFVSGKGTSVKAEADLSGKVVAVQAETTSHEWVEELQKAKIKDIKEIRSFKAATEAFAEVKTGRAQVIVIDEPVGLYYAAKDAANYTITGRAMDPEPVGIAIRKEDTDLKAAIEKAVKDLQADGTYKKLSEKWFGRELGK